MALEAVVYPQDPFGNYTNPCKDHNFFLYQFQDQYQEDKALLENLLEHNTNSANWKIRDNINYANSSISSPSTDQTYTTSHHYDQGHQYPVSQPEGFVTVMEAPPPEQPQPEVMSGRRKRRRTRSSKNKEEIENQRMTHIAVERNRRKQMNEYLAVLRSLMPQSYVQRGDQASIIGGAINFVKELEQLLQSVESHKNKHQEAIAPFSDFFVFPQYCTRSATQRVNSPDAESPPPAAAAADGAAEIEVTMVESHANLKILSKKRPRQLLKLVHGLQSLCLTILHLNVTTTVEQLVLYSLSLKVEEGCQLNTVDDIAAAVNQMLMRVEEEAAFS